MRSKKYFGQYLVGKGLITEKDVYDALEEQKASTPQVETLILKKHFLSVKECFSVLNQTAGTNFSFLDIALRDGLLTAAQIDEVMSIRDEEVPMVGDVLVQLGRLPREAMERELELFKETVRQYKQLGETLKQMVIFQELSDDDLDHLSYLPAIVECDANRRIISEGEDAASFYCIVAGSLRVTRCEPNESGKEMLLTKIHKNDVFGEAAIFYNETRTANIVTETPTTLLEFRRDDFRTFLEGHLAAAYPILLFIVKRLLAKLSIMNKELMFEKKCYVPQEQVNEYLKKYVNDFYPHGHK